MIKEVFQFITTRPSIPYAKKRGYLFEAIAMEARHKRCFAQWQSHYQKCQQAILKAAEHCLQKRTIVIMGAGSLNDIPLDSLSQQFQTVVLVDVVFLKQARQAAATYPNVFLEEADVSSRLSTLFKGELSLESEASWSLPNETDCLVSLNLATQLPLIPVRWLMQHYKLNEAAADELGKAMIQSHLNLLENFQGTRCLIADRQVFEYNASGELIDQFDPAWEVVLPDVTDSWEWHVIPLGESKQNTAQVNQVGVSIW